jgi:hypothetical protein
MKKYAFKSILQRNGWLENAIVSVNANGIITAISNNSVDISATQLNG